MGNVFAKLISRVFGPLTIEPVVLMLLLLFGADLPVSYRFTAGIILLMTNLCIPGIAIVWAFLTGRITDLDITKRQERVVVFTIAMISVWFGLTVMFFLGYSAPIFFRLLFAQAVVLTILWGLTFYEKVSLHAAGITSITATVIVLFGFGYWPLSICILLVGWARWYLKKHTISQLVLGFLIPVIIYGLFFLTLP